VIDFQKLEDELEKVKQLAQANKLHRLMHSPFRYLSAQFFRTVFFPLSKKGTLRQADTFMGYPLSILLPSGMDIYLTGGKTHDSEIRLAQFLIQFYKKGNPTTFIDIGAHVGYFSLLVSCLIEKMSSESRIYTFEAAKGTFGLLKQNLKNRKNIQTFHNALTDSDMDLTFYEFPVLYSEYNTLHVGQFENEKWFQKFKPERNTVKGRTLDSIIKEFNIKNPLVKIDTEGAEAQVISGSRELLTLQNPIIIMEFLTDTTKNEGHFKAFEMLKDMGYQVYFIKNDGELDILKDINSYFTENGLDSDNFVFKK
jgi:FkbM family methyltransferase